jgi:hypothetical protein
MRGSNAARAVEWRAAGLRLCGSPPGRGGDYAARQGVAMMVVAANIVGLATSVPDLEITRSEDE